MILNMNNSNDHSVLSCPSASDNYNYKTYKSAKKWLLLIAAIGSLVCISIVLFSQNTKVQTISATLFGGLISIIIWLVTTFVTDRIQQELNEIDRLLYKIDMHISEIKRPLFFEAPNLYKLKEAPKNDVFIQYMLLVDCCASLKYDLDINITELKLSWKEQEISIDEFLNDYEKIIKENTPFTMGEQELDMINWNLRKLNEELYGLRNKLLKQKYSIIREPIKDKK